ncbi:TPA: restriction endonuclease subunit S [Kluyvera georgiana]
MSAGKLPEGWINTTIGDISVKCSQRVPDENEQFIYVDIGSINRELKVIENPQYLIGKDAPSRARKEIKAHDIIVSLTRPNLNAVALVSEKYDEQIASTGFEVIRPTLVESRYIFALVRSRHFIDSISVLVQGALYPAAKSSDVQSYEFPLPPLAEQKIIAEKLDTLLAQVDSTKARLEQIPQILKRFRQVVLTIAINGKLTENFRVQNKLKDNWVEMPLERLACSDKYSLGIGPFGSNLKVEDYREKGHPLIFVRDIRACSFSNSETRYIDSSKFEELKAHRAKPGDLLITKMGDPPGDAAIYPSDCEEAVITADCIKLRVANELALSKFILFAIMSNEFRAKVVEISAGVAQQKVNLKNFKKLQLNIPPLPEQHEIVRRVEQLFAYADTIEKQVNSALTRVNSLTQSILAKAFRGELTAQWRAENPDLISGENSAAALLEKIKAERAASGGKKASRKKA